MSENMAPPPFPERQTEDYSPFESRLAFEIANLLYRRMKSSAGNSDNLLDLWKASLLEYGGPFAPFRDHKDLFKTIDSIPLGDVPWQCIEVSYSGSYF